MGRVTDFALPWGAGDPPEVSDELTRWIWAESGTERQTRERTDGATITYPGRNNALASLGGSMRRRGMSQPEIEAALIAVNATRVEPPLDEQDVRRIAKSVSRYQAGDDVLKLVERGQADPVYGSETSHHAGMTPVPLKDIVALPDPGYKELLGPLVYRGLRTLIAAATGEGKTTLVMWMVRAIVKGEGFIDFRGIGPDEDEREPVVLIVDAEQSIPDIQRLAAETGLEDSESIYYIHVPDGLQLGDSTNDAIELERAIESLRPDVVIVDPAYKVASIDSNNEREVVDLMRLFDRWRAEYGFAFIMPVHTRKSDKKNPGGTPALDDIFGSGAFSRGAEVILGLKAVQSGYSELYVWKHRPGGMERGDTYGMKFDRDVGFEGHAKDKAKNNDDQVVALQMWRAMKTSRAIGFTTDKLMEWANKTNTQQVYSMVARSELIESQKIDKTNHRLYILTDKAKEMFARQEETFDDPTDESLSRWEELSLMKDDNDDA